MTVPLSKMTNTLLKAVLCALTCLLGSGCMVIRSTSSATLQVEDPQLRTLFEAADARWEAAGVDPERIVISETGGLPVRWMTRADSLRTDRCNSLGDKTTLARGCVVYKKVLGEVPTRVWIASDQEPEILEHSVIHEMGHLLGVVGHLPSGHLMAIDPGQPRITEEDLAEVCAYGECELFQPEI